MEFVNKWYFNFIVQEAFDTQKKKQQMDVDVLLLITFAIVDHFIVIDFLCCFYPQVDAYYTMCNWLVIL